MIQIPSWVFGVPPTSKNLAGCRTPGLIQPSVSTYPDGDAFSSQTGYTKVEGPPKYWADPNANVALGYAKFDGSIHGPNHLSGFEKQMYDQNAGNWYTEHDADSRVVVPTMVYSGPISKAEWARLSFPNPDKTYEDPAEFPLALIWDDNPQHMTHTFPAGMVLFMYYGLPCGAKIDKANELFPMTPRMPVPTGQNEVSYDRWAQDIVLVATNGLTLGRRTLATEILRGPGTIFEKAERLVKL
jgi:hypothetical protein